ncbi:MAG: DUF5654 family protein [Candidatus Woesebacteria bacterium]|jgi:hypothetical protein
MAKIQTPKDIQDMPLSLVKNMITLATSGFGLVVALAWNEFIKTAVAEFIDPILGKSGGLISLFIYAVIMTFLAVVVTMQLASLQKKFEEIQSIVNGKDKKTKNE